MTYSPNLVKKSVCFKLNNKNPSQLTPNTPNDETTHRRRSYSFSLPNVACFSITVEYFTKCLWHFVLIAMPRWPDYCVVYLLLKIHCNRNIPDGGEGGKQVKDMTRTFPLGHMDTLIWFYMLLFACLSRLRCEAGSARGSACMSVIIYLHCGCGPKPHCPLLLCWRGYVIFRLTNRVKLFWKAEVHFYHCTWASGSPCLPSVNLLF